MHWVLMEGKVLVKIPELSRAMATHGLEPAWLPVFYNPRMEFNRDLSVVALQVYIDSLAPRKPVIVVEPLSATGVRALRYGVEVEGVLRVYAGDIDYESCRLIEENVRLNSLWDKVSVYCGDANALMHGLREKHVPALFVDIDPYGSPAPFLDSALALLGSGGLLAATATDTAVLEGSRSRAAFKKYGVRIRKIPQSREVAIRVLLAEIAKTAAAHDKHVEPLLSLWVDYYVRVFVRVERSARKALRMLEDKIGFMFYCRDKGFASFDERIAEKCADVEKLGPLWVGEIGSLSFVEKLEEEASTRFNYLRTLSRLKKLLSIVREELQLQEYPAQRLDALASSLKANVPPREEFIEELRRSGFKASRTHFDPLAVRTNAGLEELASLLAKIRPQRSQRESSL